MHFIRLKCYLFPSAGLWGAEGSLTGLCRRPGGSKIPSPRGSTGTSAGWEGRAPLVSGQHPTDQHPVSSIQNDDTRREAP